LPCFSISKNAKKFTKNLGFPLKGNPGLIILTVRHEKTGGSFRNQVLELILVA
jgi:hypothetical protein